MKRELLVQEPKKSSKPKLDVAKQLADASNIAHNFAQLVDAVSLLTVSGVAFWVGYTHDFVIDIAGFAIMFAACVIGLKGAHEFLKTLNKR